jgi:hypothetical protein
MPLEEASRTGLCGDAAGARIHRRELAKTEPTATTRSTCGHRWWRDGPSPRSDRMARSSRPAGPTTLAIENRGASPARALLYAGARQGSSLVSYGPFIGDTPDDIQRSIERYKTGVFRDYASP